MVEPRITQQLQRSGLSNKESIVYASLVELAGAFPSKLSEVTKLNRSTVYKTLTSLSIKGLVNEIEKRNKLFYTIEKPSKLIRYAKNQVSIAEDNLEKIQKIIPELEGIYSVVSNKPKVTFYEGSGTIKHLCDDMVSVKKGYEMVAFSNADLFKNSMPKKDLESFVKAKEKLNITTKAIVPDTPMGRIYSETVFKDTKKEIWPQVRFVPKDKFPFNAEITVYGDNKVSIVKFGRENVIGVIIEDETIHSMLRMIFDLSWSVAVE